MYISFLMLGSLVLGIIAWIIPLACLFGYKKAKHNSYGELFAISVSACAISLYMQIAYNNHIVKEEDWSALMDTSNASTLLSAIMLSVTVFLNIVTLSVTYKKRNNSSIEK